MNSRRLFDCMHSRRDPVIASNHVVRHRAGRCRYHVIRGNDGDSAKNSANLLEVCWEEGLIVHVPAARVINERPPPSTMQLYK